MTEAIPSAQRSQQSLPSAPESALQELPVEQPLLLAQGAAEPRLHPHTPLAMRSISRLQRLGGNQAVQRLVRGYAPTAAAPVASRATREVIQRESDTGLAETTATTQLGAEAYLFWMKKENKALPPKDLVTHLMTTVADTLAALPGSPPLPRLTFKHGVGYSSFNRTTWELTIDTLMLAQHQNVTTVGQLDGAEVGDIADTVWHESRHSEQFFRIGRMHADRMRAEAASDQQEAGPPAEVIAAAIVKKFQFPAWVAELVASAPPLTDEIERHEAEGWHAFTFGKYARYRIEMDFFKDVAWDFLYLMERQPLDTSWQRSGMGIANQLRDTSLEAYKRYEDEVDAYAVGGAAKQQTRSWFEKGKVPASKLRPKPAQAARRPERGSLPAVFKALEDSFAELADILQQVQGEPRQEFDAQVTRFINTLLGERDAVRQFQVVSSSRLALAPVTPSRAAPYAEYRDTFEDLLKQMAALKPALSGEVAPKTAEVTGGVVALKVDARAMTAKGANDPLLGTHLTAILELAVALEKKMDKLLAAETADPDVNESDPSSVGEAGEESDFKPEGLAVLLADMLQLRLAVLRARSASRPKKK